MTDSENNLSSEDLAALKYARNLKAYGDTKAGYDPDMSAVERSVVKHVRKLKRFFIMALFMELILVVLLAINLLTWTGYLWVVWPTLGLTLAMAYVAIWQFGVNGSLGENWERREIEKRLRNL